MIVRFTQKAEMREVMVKKNVLAALLVLTSAFVCPSALGHGFTSGIAESGGWGFIVAPYLWAVGLDGDMTVKGQEAEVDESFSDLLSNLDVAAEGHFEAWKGQWGGFLDITYVDLSADAKKGPLEIDLDMEMALVEFGGLFRAGQWALGSESQKLTLELLAGGRYTRLKPTLDPERQSSVSKREDWVDLITGARLLTEFNERWALLLRADIGGFGISSSTDFSANGSALVGWNFQPDWTLVAGYRALYQDYSDGSGANKFEYDITTHGPILALEYRF